MKTIYTINITTKTESNSISPNFESESEARNFFEKKKKEILGDTPADTAGWPDNDQAWSKLYQIELIKLTINDDGEVEDLETIENSDYYYFE